MKIAIFSDIHSNLQAFEAVMGDMEKVKPDAMHCLGDIVGYAADPAACLARIRALGCPCILGNHDEAVVSRADPSETMNETAVAGIRLSRKQLAPDDVAWLEGLPFSQKSKQAVFTHASLSEEEPWLYVIDQYDAEIHFGAQRSRVCFCGHTHRPGIWAEHSDGWIAFRKGEGEIQLPRDGKVLVNAGSVGQPRDGDRRACYAVFDAERKTVEFRRVEYDIPAAAAAILHARLPRFTAQRLVAGI